MAGPASTGLGSTGLGSTGLGSTGPASMTGQASSGPGSTGAVPRGPSEGVPGSEGPGRPEPLATPRPTSTGRALVAALLAGLVVVGAGATADRFARHGWTVSWYVTQDGVRTEMARSTEHRVAFPNEQRALARYVQRWDFRRFAMPSALPALDATLRARLLVPSGGRVLAVQSTDTTELRIDGRVVRADERVGAGWHRLEADWRGRFRPASEFVLTWGGSAHAQEPVPASALVPLEGSWPKLRVALWAAALLTALAASIQAFRIVQATPGLARGARVGALATAAIVLLGVGMRGFDADVMPDFRENDDERFAIWNGYSLLEDGTTRGITLWWAEYAAHGHGTIETPQYFDRTYHVVTPYFEHPPLLHLLAGAAGHLGGARSHLEVPLAHARVVPIALSALTLLLMIMLGRRLDPLGPAPWFGALLWAALPWIALQTRVVKEDVLVTALGVGSVLAFVVWRDARTRRHLVLAAVLAGLAPLAKVTGAAFVLSLLILVAREARARDFVLAAVVSTLTAALLPLFGASIDWSAFAYTQGLQSGRAVHWNIFLRFFDSPLINHSLIGRGWLLFLWLGAAAGLSGRAGRDRAVLAVPLMTYLAAIALGSGTWTFGWYVTPLLPFLCLASGRFLADLWKAPDLFRGAVFLFVLVFYSLNFSMDPAFAKDPSHWAEIRREVTVALALGLAPFALHQAFGRAWLGWARAAVAAGLALVVVLGALFVVRYETLSTTYRDFDRDRYFDR